MGYFGAIVRVLGRVVGDTGHDVPLGNSVAAQLVGHERTRFLALTLQELSEESPRRTPVPTGLDEKVNQVTVLVHGTPQILALTVDRDEDFVQKPRISESTLTSLQPPGVIGAELPAPLPNSFVRHDDAAFGQQILDIPEAQAVSGSRPGELHPQPLVERYVSLSTHTAPIRRTTCRLTHGCVFIRISSWRAQLDTD